MRLSRISVAAGLIALLAMTGSGFAQTRGVTGSPSDTGIDTITTIGTVKPGSGRHQDVSCSIDEKFGLKLVNKTGKTIKKGTVLTITLQPSGKVIKWTATQDIAPGAAIGIKGLVSPRDKAANCAIRVGMEPSNGDDEPSPPNNPPPNNPPPQQGTNPQVSCDVAFATDLHIANSGDMTFPPGTKVIVTLPDGTTKTIDMGGYVPGGDMTLSQLFPDGVPEGYTCQIELVLPPSNISGPLQCVKMGPIPNSSVDEPYLLLNNISDQPVPAGTVVKVKMPDGTWKSFTLQTDYVPGGSAVIMGEFPNGFPDGWFCEIDVELP